MAERSVKERVCVYDMILNGKVVYVGMTKQPKVRLHQHRSNGIIPREAELFVHKWYGSREKAAIAEKKRQNKLEPKYCKDLDCLKKPKPPKVPAFKLKKCRVDHVANKKAIDDFNSKYTHEQMNEYLKFIEETKGMPFLEVRALAQTSGNPLLQRA